MSNEDALMDKVERVGDAVMGDHVHGVAPGDEPSTIELFVDATISEEELARVVKRARSVSGGAMIKVHREKPPQAYYVG